MTDRKPVSGSFRDPNGFLYQIDGDLYRQVNLSYGPEYDHLVGSGLLAGLVRDQLLVEHEEADLSLAAQPDAYRVLKPQRIPVVSYPFEWCFGQLKTAALLTLTILRRALDQDMVLKDASAYNVQFVGARAIFIDTLSFERYRVGTPWVGYRQFCQHFLAPLALMSKVDVRLAELYQTNIDGIPLDLAASLLPVRAKLRPAIGTHIALHARTQRRFAQSDGAQTTSTRRVSKLGLLGIVQNLEAAVRRLTWRPSGTEWGDYRSAMSYSDEAAESKRRLLEEFLSAKGRRPLILDIGANKGDYSAVAARHADYVVAMDADPAAVELHYRRLEAGGASDVLPLHIDLAAPSPGIGWSNTEREALTDRFQDATVVALALIHHLAISNNVPLAKIAEFLSGVADELIIEFVPKSDPQVSKLLASREDIFPRYTPRDFEEDFSRHFVIRRSEPIAGSERKLYLMERGHG